MNSKRKPFVPTKGGDGGVVPRIVVRLGTTTTINRNANSRRAMTCVPPDDWSRLQATRDPFDRAHSVRDDATNMLVPAATRRGRSVAVNKDLRAVPRLYPKCYMTSAGVSFETAYEWLAEAEAGLHGVPGMGYTAVAAIVKATLAKLPDSKQKHDAMRAKSSDGRSKKEMAADRAADRWAATHGVDLQAWAKRGGDS